MNLVIVNTRENKVGYCGVSDWFTAYSLLYCIHLPVGGGRSEIQIFKEYNISEDSVRVGE